jgi:hypothetical protein
LLADDRKRETQRLELEIKNLAELQRVNGAGALAAASELAQKVKRLEAQVSTALAMTAFHEVENDGDVTRFWSRPAKPWECYTEDIAKSIPILFWGNQKGGVAKTMTAINWITRAQVLQLHFFKRVRPQSVNHG